MLTGALDKGSVKSANNMSEFFKIAAAEAPAGYFAVKIRK
jgi:hypothetical protein